MVENVSPDIYNTLIVILPKQLHLKNPFAHFNLIPKNFIVAISHLDDVLLLKSIRFIIIYACTWCDSCGIPTYLKYIHRTVAQLVGFSTNFSASLHNLVQNWVELWTTFIHLIFNFEHNIDSTNVQSMPMYASLHQEPLLCECVAFRTQKVANGNVIYVWENFYLKTFRVVALASVVWICFYESRRPMHGLSANTCCLINTHFDCIRHSSSTGSTMKMNKYLNKCGHAVINFARENRLHLFEFVEFIWLTIKYMHFYYLWKWFEVCGLCGSGLRTIFMNRWMHESLSSYGKCLNMATGEETFHCAASCADGNVEQWQTTENECANETKENEKMR